MRDWFNHLAEECGDRDEVQEVHLRRLTRDEVVLTWTIDRSEVHHHIYELRDGRLVRTPKYFEIPGWRRDALEEETPLLLDCFDRGGTFLGVFDAETLVGMGVLESARVGRASDQMQLAYLYVSRAYRGHGVGARLFDAAVSLAREAGASALTSPPYQPRTPSSSISIAAACLRLSPTQGSWPPNLTIYTSSIRSDAHARVARTSGAPVLANALRAESCLARHDPRHRPRFETRTSERREGALGVRRVPNRYEQRRPAKLNHRFSGASSRTRATQRGQTSKTATS